MASEGIAIMFSFIAVVVCVAVVLYKYFEERHKERMAMIEKGLKPGDYKGADFPSITMRANPLNSLKWGLVALFVGTGFFTGLAMSEFAHFQGSFSVALMILFGGLGLIVFYFIAAKKLKEEREERS
jgi:hypothetical protein